MFYGRVSTEDRQDPATSRVRQLDQAAALMAGHGRIVAEYFDVGQTRVLPWARRPEAAALVAAMADPDRAFDAIVVGEYERAFYGNQFSLMAPLFDHYGVQLWLPEAGGPVDLAGEAHEQLMIGLGILCRSETRFRALSWCFAVGSAPWLGTSRGVVVAALPVGEVPVRSAGGAGPIRSVQGRRVARAASREPGAAPSGWRSAAVGPRRPALACSVVSAGEPSSLVGHLPHRPGDDLALASPPGRPQVDLHRSAATRTTSDRDFTKDADRSYGTREPDVGASENPG